MSEDLANGQELARAARELFLEQFARPYKENGRVNLVGPMHGSQEQQRRALLPHEYLARRGLTERANSARIFRISDFGKDLAFREHELDAVLGITPDSPSTASSFDPQSVRLLARSAFEEYFRSCDQHCNVIPEDKEALAALRELARKGLARETPTGGAFLIGQRGIEVCMGEADLDEILGLTSSAVSSLGVALTPTTVNVFHGPVGAVAAAQGAFAHGTVNVQSVDDALRKAIELQDDLGELTDALIPLLRAARKREREGSSEDALAVAIQEAEEFRTFEKMVKPCLAQASVRAARAVLDLVPVLKAASALLPK
jgi:hypothetical protein